MIPERTIGETIRLSREEKGLSQEDVSRETRISLAVIRKIEHDRFGELPGGLYTKNYIRILADHLNLDREFLLAGLQSGQAAEAGEEPGDGVWQEETVPETRVRAWRPGWRFWISLLILLVAAALALVIWRGWPTGGWGGRDGQAPSSSEIAPLPADGGGGEALPGEIQPGEGREVPGNAGEGEEPAAGDSGPSAQPATDDFFLRPPPLIAEASQAGAKRPAAPAGGKPLLCLEIEADGPCRVQVGVDGRRQLARSFVAGERWTLYGEEFFILTARRAERFRLRFNGEDYALPRSAGNTSFALRLDAPGAQPGF